MADHKNLKIVGSDEKSKISLFIKLIVDLHSNNILKLLKLISCAHGHCSGSIIALEELMETRNLIKNNLSIDRN